MIVYSAPVDKLVVVPRGFQGAAVHPALMTSVLEDRSEILLPIIWAHSFFTCMGWLESLCTYGVAGCCSNLNSRNSPTTSQSRDPMLTSKSCLVVCYCNNKGHVAPGGLSVVPRYVVL